MDKYIRQGLVTQFHDFCIDTKLICFCSSSILYILILFLNKFLYWDCNSAIFFVVIGIIENHSCLLLTSFFLFNHGHRVNRFTYHIVSISNLTLFATPSCCDYNAPQKTISKNIHPQILALLLMFHHLSKFFFLKILMSLLYHLWMIYFLSCNFQYHGLFLFKLLFHILGDIQVTYLAGFLEGVCPKGGGLHRRETHVLCGGHVFFKILMVTRPKRKRSSSNHPFSGANMLVSERVSIWRIIQLRQPLKYGWLSGTRYLLKDTVDGRNPANQLRLVVYPMIYKVHTSQVVVWNFFRQK